MILSLMKLKTDQIDMKMTMNLSGKLLLAGILAFSIHGAFAQNNPGRKIGYVKVSPDSSLVDAVRKAREMRRLGQADSVVIRMEAGCYKLYEPLVLRPEDSHLCFEGTPSGKMEKGRF